jgi:hypothetical protein
MAKQTAGERRPFWSSVVVGGFMLVSTLVVVGLLAYIPVTQYFEMRGQLAEADAEADALEAARLEAQSKLVDAEKRNAERARCFNTWVPIGEETYVVQGLLTCDD